MVKIKSKILKITYLSHFVMARSPPAKLRSSCKIDVTYFPFDDQHCHLKFGSWAYSGLQINLTTKYDTAEIDPNLYIQSGEWELRKITVENYVQYYPCCPAEPYPAVIYSIIIRRRVLYYVFNIIIPCIWLSILTCVGFYLPHESGK